MPAPKVSMSVSHRETHHYGEVFCSYTKVIDSSLSLRVEIDTPSV